MEIATISEPGKTTDKRKTAAANKQANWLPRIRDLVQSNGAGVWETVMAPQGDAPSAMAIDDGIAEQARAAAPLVWLLGKVQSGKSSIVKALTACDDAQIGSGFKACTRDSALFEFPREAPVIRFLDTCGLGEPGYDPRQDIAFCNSSAHLLLVVMKAMDPSQNAILDVVKKARAKHPQLPIIVAQSSLHEGYASGQMHPHSYPYAGTKSAADSLQGASPAFDDLNRALSHQRALFDGVPGTGPILFVPLDFTRVGDGFEPALYGLDALIDALFAAAPLGLAASLAETAQEHGGELAARAHPHVRGYAAAAAAVDALPVAGLLAVPVVQAKMMHSLARIYGVRWDKQMWIEFSACLGTGAVLRLMASLGIREAVKLLPAYGQTLATASAAATSFATTMALGKAASYFLKLRSSGRTDPDGVKAAYAAALSEALTLARGGR